MFQDPPDEGNLSDLSDEPFSPDVDMSKPWVTVDTTAPSIAVEAKRNLANAMTNIPIGTKEKMGSTIEDMLQECSWNGRTCSTRLVHLVI